MIAHADALGLAADAVDATVTPDEAAALADHLADCADCRAVDAGMHRDAAALQHLDLGPVPINVRAEIAIAAEHRGHGARAGRWIGLVAVGTLLVVALGGGVIGGGATEPPIVPGNAVSWKTEVAALSAADFGILANGRTFTGRVPGVDVQSDPGDAHYRTLELTWKEQGVEQRLTLYFGADDASWWVDEIRIRNGKADAQWLYADGPFFKSPVGQPWSGDIDIAMQDRDRVGGTPARLHLGGAVIATQPSDLVNVPPGGGVQVTPEMNPFATGGALHCSGILQLSPREAEARLAGLGYAQTWRLERTTGPRMGFADESKHAPDGVITSDPGVGTSGELVIFVAPFGDERAIPVPFPEDCPVPGGSPPAPVDTVETPAP